MAQQAVHCRAGWYTIAPPRGLILLRPLHFGVSVTELVAGSYIYRLPPATTHGFVQRLQTAFRDAAAANQASIKTWTTA